MNPMTQFNPDNGYTQGEARAFLAYGCGVCGGEFLKTMQTFLWTDAWKILKVAQPWVTLGIGIETSPTGGTRGWSDGKAYRSWHYFKCSNLNFQQIPWCILSTYTFYRVNAQYCIYVALFDTKNWRTSFSGSNVVWQNTQPYWHKNSRLLHLSRLL